MKAIGNEFKSYQAILDSGISEICIPLCCVYDYLGKRVICSSVVEKESLVQGQEEKWRGIIRPEKEVERVMEMLGRKPFIEKGSKIATRDKNGKNHSAIGLYGGFDLQVHRVDDGNLYILNPRLFPCDPNYKSNQLLLRKELIRKCEIPVATDAFCFEINSYYDCKEYQERVIEVGEKLKEEVEILARDLSKKKNLKDLKSLFHDHGINMRYLLKVAEKVENKENKDILIKEAVCKSACLVVKKEMRKNKDFEIEKINKKDVLKEMKKKYGREVEFESFDMNRIKELTSFKVKSFSPPKFKTIEDLRQNIELQETILKGSERIKMIPNLLELGKMIGNEVEIQIERKKFLGDHPFVKAFNLCSQYDPLWKLDRFGYFVDFSFSSFPVIETVLFHMQIFYDKYTSLYLRSLVEKVERDLGKDHFVFERAERLRNCTFMSSINRMRACVCKDKDWDVLIKSSETDEIEDDVRGEGCGGVLISRRNEGEENYIGKVRGYSINQDGRSNGLTAPNGPSQVKLIKESMRKGGLEAEEVSFIEAHGTGTSLGDPIEVQALEESYGRGRKSCVVMGTAKTNVGHCETAAGIVGVLKALMSMEKGEMSRHLHLQKLNEYIGVELMERMKCVIGNEEIEWKKKGEEKKKICGVSSFGFSGTNCHLILEEERDFGEEVEEGKNEYEVFLKRKIVFAKRSYWLGGYLVKESTEKENWNENIYEIKWEETCVKGSWKEKRVCFVG